MGHELREEAVSAFFSITSEIKRPACSGQHPEPGTHRTRRIAPGHTSQQISSTGEPLGIVSAPAMGYAVVNQDPNRTPPVQVNQHPEGFALENEFVVAKFDLGVI